MRFHTESRFPKLPERQYSLGIFLRKVRLPTDNMAEKIREVDKRDLKKALWEAAQRFQKNIKRGDTE